MPHKHKPIATAEQLCAAIQSLATTSSSDGDQPVSSTVLAAITSITPSSISWLCSSSEMQPLVQRILAMAEQPKQQQPVEQPSPVIVDEQGIRSAVAANEASEHALLPVSPWPVQIDSDN